MMNLEIKYRPILFSTPMVQAIIEGRKTQTRRIIKLRDKSLPDETEISFGIDFGLDGEMIQGKPELVMDFSKTFPYWKEQKPKYKVGDVLWVRESYSHNYFSHNNHAYKADWNNPDPDVVPKPKWKPLIHMPKSACRIFLKITNIRIQRLQDIDSGDAISEGIEVLDGHSNYKNYLYGDGMNYTYVKTPKLSFCTLWKSINGKDSWESNPWVWVIEFEKIEKPEDWK